MAFQETSSSPRPKLGSGIRQRNPQSRILSAHILHLYFANLGCGGHSGSLDVARLQNGNADAPAKATRRSPFAPPPLLQKARPPRGHSLTGFGIVLSSKPLEERRSSPKSGLNTLMLMTLAYNLLGRLCPLHEGPQGCAPPIWVFGAKCHQRALNYEPASNSSCRECLAAPISLEILRSMCTFSEQSTSTRLFYPPLDIRIHVSGADH